MAESRTIRNAPPWLDLRIILLILAGEAAFLLPFVLPRIFRPTVLSVFQMNNQSLGSCFSVYGMVALLSYLLGGPIADRFQPRNLIAIALLSTSVGGFVTATYPSHSVMLLVYGYWGFTTIFLLWAALLKATRQWGGTAKQGRAFGFLDGGRGLVSALLGSASVIIFSMTMATEAGAEASFEQQQAAFRYVILFTSGLVALVGILVWLFLGTTSGSDAPIDRKLSLGDVLSALSLPSVWLLMLVVLCGYVGYKVTDDLSLYAKEVMLFDEVRAAQLGTFLLYLRPIVGVAAGFLADWSRSATWIIAGFASMLIGAVIVGMGVTDPGAYGIFFASLFATCIGVYAIRSLYFAAMQEGNVPLSITGTAIGLISVIGYTPDIFMGPVSGYLLDGWPGEPGHQYLFWLLAGFSAVGLVVSIIFRLISAPERQRKA